MVHNRLLFCLFGIMAYYIISTVARKAVADSPVAAFNQFPYQVSLQTQDEGHICGGGIINTRLVLTAANCVISDHGHFKNEHFTVLAGTNDLRKIESPAVTVRVDMIYVPREYEPPLNRSTGDIAILKLQQSLHLSSHGNLMKLELAKDKRRIPHTYNDKSVMLAGFNCDDDLLRYSQVLVYDNDICKFYHPSITNKHFCARIQTHYSTVRSVCDGDDGGPLVYNGTIVIGVVSRIPHPNTEQFGLSVYTRISHYLEFIHHVEHGLHNHNDIRTHRVVHTQK